MPEHRHARAPTPEEAVLAWRHARDHAFADSPESPIPERERASFAGLSYFDYDPAWRLDARLDALEEPEHVHVATSDGAIRGTRRVGQLVVRALGEEIRLDAFEQEGRDSLFVPFRDATSGKETYGAGRYVDAIPPAGGFLLDLNLAYNPSCAYDEAYSCPLPPQQNWLKIPVRAGEKLYAPSPRANPEDPTR